MNAPAPQVVAAIMRTIGRTIRAMELPAVEKIAEDRQSSPFHVLISTLLSARTQDATTHAASERLFEAASTPEAMARLTVARIERLIYPVSFYRNKARHVKAACQLLEERFGGRVPSTMEELLKLPGVGRKTANLVLILAHQSRDNICVDTHVHRIANRLGWVRTRDSRGDRAGALPTGREAVVGRHQPVSGHLGPERVPADWAALPVMPGQSLVSHGSRPGGPGRRSFTIAASSG